MQAKTKKIKKNTLIILIINIKEPTKMSKTKQKNKQKNNKHKKKKNI